ncbi:hypothetical protein [Ensifer sp. Root1252]|uniref:hypothetical protein n=1 Tax=unclassified Ensifer TaxID=2633371 RepID=UPI003241E6B4
MRTYIFESAGLINSAGGDLCYLTAKARRGEFLLGPVVMALLGAQIKSISPACSKMISNALDPPDPQPSG